MVDLTDELSRMLDLERSQWKYPGAKDSAIREQFGIGSTRHYHVLNWVIDQSEALAYDPLGVQRLRRLRARRVQQRSSRRNGFDAG
ncbi:MAG TPA: DUF3263 domain-containing protein [Marmoricola sp.]|nr:DUF3263 domain-containing protein [Marmoricola sp.]